MKEQPDNPRIQIARVEPAAYHAMMALESYLAAADLPVIHYELIKIRASQINGCAFCINMHTRDALKAGETAQRIFLLNAWRETDLFSEEEKLLLQMTEEITLIHQSGLSDATYRKAVETLGEQRLAQIIMVIVTINAWNRIAIATKMEID